MPLLKRKAFEKSAASEYLRDDDEVFHCEITDEIFKDYEEYCERIILVNSMVWSCEMTGKNNLTYSEALESEKAARRQLKDFPWELRIPILYLAAKTKRSSFAEMTEDVFNFVRERYFVGEAVEGCLEGHQWAEAHVLSVTSQKQLPGSNTIPQASSFIYEVEQFNDSESGGQIGTIPHDRVRRRKGVYTRDKNRLFLKQFVEQGPGGIICIKKSALDKYNISKVSFEQIFTGNPPTFASSKKLMKSSISPTKSSSKPGSATKLNKSAKKATPDKKGKQESMDKFVKKTDKNEGMKTAPKPKLSTAESAAKKVQQQQLLEKMRKAEDQLRQKREDEKAMKKEKNAKLQAYLKEWQKVKEDLELEDHKIIPKGTPVEVPGVAAEDFGDFLSILEFTHNFSDILKVKEFFHYDLDLDTLRKALTMPVHAGLLCDLVQMFLTTIFQLQEDEAEEYNEDGVIQEYNAEEADANTEMNVNREMELATKASKWSHTYLGTPLSKLPLDPTTVSEVLRLHLLSSGGAAGSRAAAWRYQQRGGYSARDDAAAALRRRAPAAPAALGAYHIAELQPGDILQIIQCLMNQLLSYAAFRDVIEEKLEDFKTKKHTLRTMQINERKREIQLVAARQELKKETALKKEENKLNMEVTKAADEEFKNRIEKMNSEGEEKRKDYEKKHKQLQDELFDFATYLGSDRAYRRYYIGRRVPGIFAEAGAEPRGPCRDKPVPIHQHQGDKDDVLAYVTKLFDEREKGGSDKENDSGANSRGNSPKKPLTNLNGLTHKLNSLEPATQQYTELMVCTGDINSCYVHGKNDRPKWWVYHTEEQVEGLIQSLNKRGLRESDLKQALEQDKANLLEYLKKCPVHYLNPSVAEAPVVYHHWKRRKLQPSLVVAEDAGVAETVELALRDHVLELEEKIFHGCLGTIQVKDREAWRGTIMLKGYDKQAEFLTWGPNKQFRDDYHLPNGQLILPNGTLDSDVKVAVNKYRDPGHYLEQSLNGKKSAIVPPAAVRSLASALLQVSQAIHHKYLKRPLGLDEKERKDREAKNKSLDFDALERWEVSLMECRSFAQVFLHLLTLDSSIMWSASIFNASCRLCRRKTDPDNMLLCDGCNKGHHLYCLKPKLTKVPEGDWFCDVCKPKPTKERTPRKKRKLFSDEDLEDEFNSEDEVPAVCGLCGSGGRMRAACASCAAPLHAECAPRRRALCAHCTHGNGRAPSNRRCAAAAISNIHMYTKALNSSVRNSSDSEDSEYNTALVKLKQNRSRGSKDVSPAPNGRKGSRKSKEHSYVKKTKKTLTNGHAEDTKGRRSRPKVELHVDGLLQLLRETNKHRDSWPFIQPVDTQEVPDYLDIIDVPMDFETIKTKLEQEQYTSDEGFLADVVQIFNNCYTYNGDTHPVSRAGYRLHKYLQRRCSELGLPSLPEISVEYDDEDEDSSNKRRTSTEDADAPKAKKAKLK